MATLIGDRFARTAGGWLDLVSGRIVDVQLGAPPEDVAARMRRCEVQLQTLAADGAQLVDFAPVGVDGWFEAIDTRVDIGGAVAAGGGRGRPPEFSLTCVKRSAIADVEAVATDPALCGVTHLRLVAPPHSGGRVAVQGIARALRRLGFVTLRADLALPPDVRRALRHRHLVLLAMAPNATAAASRWAARLTAVSNRGHLLIERVATDPDSAGSGIVVRLEPCSSPQLVEAYVPGTLELAPAQIDRAAESSGGWPGRFALEIAGQHAALTGPAVARERAELIESPSSQSAWPFSTSLRPSSPPARLISRAAACHRRGRTADGDRWLSAGLEASRRRGDSSAVLRALEDWVPRLISEGRWHRAAAMATRALGDAVDPPMRATVARLAAFAHLEAGQVSRADACIGTAVAIEQLILDHPTDASIAVRAAIHLWQGRWREGRDALDALPPDRLRAPLIGLWRELLAWADDDGHRQRWMVGGADPKNEAHVENVAWRFAVLAFRAAASGESSRLRAALADGAGVGSGWRTVITAQAWLELGDEDAAAREIDALAVRPMASRGLVDLAAVSIRCGLNRASNEERRWFGVVTSRERLRGMVRWGQGRSAMQMLHDVSELLEVVQAAEDESVGLSQVSQWVQAASTATACAIVSAPAGDVVAGATLADVNTHRSNVLTWLDRPAPALDEGPAQAHARAPIRYGGHTIGLVLAVAPPARARALLEAVQAAAAVSGAMLRARIDGLTAAARGDTLAREILGASPAIEAVRAAAARAATAPFAVVIEGESGTGKELVARALHRLGPRRDRVFAALNCAALTDELVEAELFGHARGAFTHAVNARAGLFEEANNGTLFLDEVGDLSPRAQAKLLRVLQEGEIRRVGENESRSVDVRVVAATNRPLPALVAAGKFRDDLMFRLSVIRIHVPPLRERSGDVPELALTFWRQAARRVGTRAMVGPDALALLAGMPWPGNVRELQNAMAAIAVAAPATGRIGARLVRHVLHSIASGPATDAEIVPLDEARRQVERRVVTAALAKHTGSRMDAANALGLSRQGLSKAMRRLGLANAGVA